MRTLTFVLCLAVSTVAYAEDKKPGGGMNQEQKLAEKKAKFTEMLDKRIASLQQARTCVQRAQNDQQLQGCQPK